MLRLWRPESTIISDVVDGEAIVINMIDGRYHRITGPAVELWEALKTEIALDLLTRQALGLDSSLTAGDVARFVNDLFQSGLLACSAVDPTTLQTLAVGASDGPPKLQLESYDDMADLILLDPVHEVGEYGWPLRPSAGA